ncbi:CBN-CRB-1 protein [Caenorhabditis brenneri]|uniref:CBN-CRB-1 protein n=1 Tax=Caenorhabditis brenneri TaxID=135651 RepID=G0MIF2_CAEBE|nr:CBN-CRB-1 protein [Caenorhabditis brenneri]
MKYQHFLIVCTLVTNALCDRACSRNTCLNGGTCTVNDETRMFQCECPQGFSGLLCQDNCSLHCLHGNCLKGTFGEETCQCSEGWMGSLCDILVTDAQKCTPQCDDEERCTKGADGSYFCQNTTSPVSSCTTHTCENNGTCVTENGNAKCSCVNGFVGEHCETDVDQCRESFCQNGASCENLIGGYNCICLKGYSGKYCEVQDKKNCTANYCQNDGVCNSNSIELTCECPDGFEGDFCETKSKANDPLIGCTCENPAHVCSLVNGTTQCECPSGFMGSDCKELKARPCDLEPCLNGGHCVDDGQNLFTCFCLPHWTGVYCGEPVECLVNGSDCKNGGKCVFSLTSTSCECLEGFTGANCEVSNSYRSHPTCSDIRCQNGGVCKIDAEGEPYCDCPEGYEGPFCEPKSGCTINPCQNGGTCQDADGQYFCHCKNGFAGVHCETLEEPSTPIPTLGNFPVLTTSGVDQLSQNEITCEDCVNSSNCLDTESGLVCVCRSGFFGQKCDQKHNKCAKVVCPAGQTCNQISENNNITAQCGCDIGHFGQKCEMVTSATFTAKSLYIHQSSKFSLGTSSFENMAYELEFTFRTTVENTHLASSEDILGEKILTIQLVSGYLVFNVTGNFMTHLLPMKINDAHWYTVSVKGENDNIEVVVLDENSFKLVQKSLTGQLEVFLTRFGKISGSHHFIGCMADVRVDGELIIFPESKRAIEIRKGCTRSEQCSRAYCQNEGVCVDHWESSSCKCKPPFLKPNCAYFLPKTTFGHLDQPSIVHLSTSETENHLLRNQIELSFLMRSGKPDAVLFYIGEKHAADVLTNYLVVKIAGGLISVRYRTGGRREIEFNSKNRVDDNREHHVQIFVDRNRRQIIIDDLTEASEPITSRMSQEFYVDDIVIGASNVVASDSEFYKGYLQDIQINHKSVIIHPTSLAIEKIGKLEKTQNVIEGAVSDPMCTSNACKHGECTETFNDFTCQCSDGSTGKHCDKVDYCREAKCVEGSKCENAENGHYCVFPITISNGSKLTYSFDTKSSLSLTNLKFSLRSHSHNGHIFTLTVGTTTLSAYIFKKRFALVNNANQKFDSVIADGKWHTIELLPFKVTVDGKSYISTTQLFPSESKSEASLFIGEQGQDVVFACLDNFQIGNYPKLSFTKTVIPTTSETWSLTDKTSVGTGCISTEQCGLFSTCLNGGTCNDIWNKRKCTCPAGFTGENCEENVNDCKYMDCGKNGYCLDGIDGSSCVCNNGFTGDHCEHATDECEGTDCHNGGRCVKEGEKVTCKCDGSWMGDHCNVTFTTSCKDSPCQNFGQCMQKTDTAFECNCMDGYSGELCEQRDVNECNHYDCYRGHCVMTVSGPACQCELGYTGRFCEKLLNHCSSNTCSTRGTCHPVWNNTICNCDNNWRGPHCQYPSNACLDFPCNNDGVCRTSEENTFTCECQKFFMGTRCEIEGSCLKADCVHGECIQLSPEKHTCSCNIGYEGDACDKRIDYCKAGPCLNEASCENKLTGYKCTCAVGFEGADCEVNIDECAFGHCKNGAKCRDKINDYDCICDGTGYEGRNCTIDINECENPNNCINGECSNTLGGYKCACKNGFIGPRCSLRNPCTAQIASNNISSVTCVHGKCVNPVVHIEKNREVAKYECACDRGYTGPTCSQRIKESAMSNISYLFGPIIAVVIVFAILGCLLLFFVIRGNNAMHGHYSPSSHEFTQNRMAMPTVIKLPPQERLI